MIVRLKALLTEKNDLAGGGFNSMIVRLKVSIVAEDFPKLKMFQFYDSPIKSPLEVSIVSPVSVSIL